MGDERNKNSLSNSEYDKALDHALRVGAQLEGVASYVQNAVTNDSSIVKAVEISEELQATGHIPHFDNPAIGAAMQNYTSVFSQVQDTVQRVNELTKSSLSIMREAMSSVASLSMQAISSYQGIAEAASRAFEAIRESTQLFAYYFPQIPWGDIEEEYLAWGEYGWVGFELLDGDIVPTSQKMADELGRQLITQDILDGIIAELKETVQKKRDLSEAVFLYENRHYKSCAMMLFSLIECELFKKAHKPKSGWRKPQSVYQEAINQDNPNRSMCIMAGGAFAAYEHLFANANDFDRSCETDINRNFLMHGMRKDPVRKYHCIKLFALLRATVAITHC